MKCGPGIRTRSRECNSPFPRHGGRPCAGSDTESNFCRSGPCPGKYLLVTMANKQTIRNIAKSFVYLCFSTYMCLLCSSSVALFVILTFY